MGERKENSEGSLILLTYSPDFDSAIRRFDPSRPSQLILLVKIALSLLRLEMRIPLPVEGTSRLPRWSGVAQARGPPMMVMERIVSALSSTLDPNSHARSEVSRLSLRVKAQA